MKLSQHPNMIVPCLPFALCLSIQPSIAALGTLVVLGVQLLRTTKLFEKKMEIEETFDGVPGVLTITRVAPRCRDTVKPARLCRGTW
jgi:hypothetical protein